MKRLAQTVLFVALLASLTLALPDEAHAQGTVNFDIDPETTGNSASTLGTVENCYAVTCPSAECTWDGTPGEAFDGSRDYVIDVVVTGDTEAPTNYHASLNYDETKVHVAELGTDPLIKMGGAQDLSEVLPDTDGTFAAGAMYLGGGPGTAGSGTIARVGLDIGASGVVTFSLNAAPLTSYASGAGSHPIAVDSGMLAINETCSDAVGGTAELPDVSGSVGRSYVALAGLAGLAGLAAGALSAAGWYARRRWVR